MQCDYCDSKATVFFTQIIDGNSKKSCLCEECATKQGVTDPEGFLLGDIKPPSDSGSDTSGPNSDPKDPGLQIDVNMGGETSEANTSTNAPYPYGNPGICPGCGFAFDDLKKTGRLGCSQCYQFFRSEIKNNLGGMHVGTSHSGRVPEGMLEAFEHRQRLEQLQQEMNEAISDENYEKAAGLRDQISQLSEPTVENEDNTLTLEP